jgi:hypothetical protein
MSKTVSAILISVAIVFAAVPTFTVVTWHDEAGPKALLADAGSAGENGTGHLGVSAYRAAAERMTNAAHSVAPR